ncbi:hypothetical protein Fcan01_10692 [Folsomia candida]|uniref:Odorant receptor n=1 Tax=Folsomia candida TaxID=158441 RepID=A0A226E8X4_FOLCA|nr:hypothetical protein Fcan01_10692 [Folsomia candida]
MLPNWSLRYRNLAFQVNSLRAWETWFCIGMRTAEKFCLFPVEWEDCTRSVKYGTNRVKNAIWYCALAYLMMDTGYQMVNIFTLNYHTTPVDDIIKLLLHGLTRLAACGLIYGFLENYESSMRLFNQICRIHRKLKGVYHGDRHFVIQDGILICLALGSLTIHFQPLGPPIQYLQERQSIRYWGSRLLPPSFYNSLFGIILFAFAELYISYIADFGAGYAATLLVVYTQTTRYWLAVLLNNSTNSLTRPWLNTKNLCLYRTLHVLNCVQNETCSEILWPVAQQVLATIHTLTNVLAIKCFHKLQMPVPILLLMSTCAFASFEKTAVKGAADVYEVSDKFRQGICRQASRRGRTIGRSIRCLRIQVGAAYYFKMSTFNTFMRTVVELTINVMLTLF